MASDTASSLVKRNAANDIALMPPPPTKRIKRPPKVLDEDQYTSGLSNIIARDYFPGLLETQAQQEYLTALDSNNEAWIAEAGQKLRDAMAPVPAGKRRRSARNSRFDTPGATPQQLRNVTPAADTPRGWSGGDTPASVAGSEYSTASTTKDDIDTSNLSLSAFQAKYTSEDNESFNTLLDKQNEKRRLKSAHLWAQDAKIPSARQIAWRAHQQRLLTQRVEDEANGKALIQITTGATESRPAKPDSWSNKKPDNTFMFNASSVDEDGLQTTAEVREANSKAPPKSVVYGNTRFPIQALETTNGPIPPSPSLNTSIIARRDAARDARSETDFSAGGGETPRINGYAFVDEDEPEDVLPSQNPPSSGPSYRDLLAGQAGDGTPNPFKLGETRRREELHHRMVERENAKKRAKALEGVKLPLLGMGTPVGGGGGGGGAGAAKTPAGGNMTPAAKKLMEKLGRTPRGGGGNGNGNGNDNGKGPDGAKDGDVEWRTPRRKHPAGKRKVDG